ncbi:cell division cycle protein 20 homolog [Tubulanus polymorphus]|uniref:cell division cycle protein 20 homolog n=1 Tax=Tubulanus polymorphus TaxID=672921 RepID=UPI003DA466E7
MSHFNFENTLNELVKLDAPIERGPMMRWQRKALETGRQALSPLKLHSGSVLRTPAVQGKDTKTPNKNSSLSKTPNKKTPSTPLSNTADRFIPNRGTTDVDMAHYKMMNQENELVPDGGGDQSDNPDYQKKLSDALGKNPQDSKVLSFTNKVPRGAEGYMNNLKVLYSSGKTNAQKATVTRHIPQVPDRILDAPELVDDYYLNLLDWSCNNHIAVSLGPAVYVWNATSGNIVELMELTAQDEYISSIKWIKEGNIVAVATSSGEVQLWDVGQQKKMRTMASHSARVGSLSWNAHILSSGSRTGKIHHHDVRVQDHHIGTLTSHTQEVCGLAWSPDGRHLASGANDNQLCIWDATMSREIHPVHTFTEHQAAVRALAWCPWQSSLLASGGGTADRNIRFFNISTGFCLNSVDTGSQVCSILWSSQYRELVSGHGFSRNQLTMWKYPAMSVVSELFGHTARVLCLCLSPDGSTVASAAADETIRLWKCFACDKPKKITTKKKSDSTTSSSLTSKMR